MEFERKETVLVNTECRSGTVEDDRELQELFYQLGKAYFEGGYEDPLPQLLPLFDQISEILHQHEKHEKQGAVCMSCGAELEEGARFCDACGAPAVMQKEDPPVPSDPMRNICPECGKILRPGAKFCGTCGRKR